MNAFEFVGYAGVDFGHEADHATRAEVTEYYRVVDSNVNEVDSHVSAICVDKDINWRELPVKVIATVWLAFARRT